MDCLEGMKQIADNSIDMILCDLPYGITNKEWDNIIPFVPLWEEYERIIKQDGAIVLSASSVFTNMVINSKQDLYRYKWVWIKNNVTNPMNARNKPMSSFEEILVFSKATTANQSLNKMKYFPQGLQTASKQVLQELSFFHWGKEQKSNDLKYTNYPKDILFFSQDKNRFHPTQEPVALFEYLIKTYTKPEELVLDNCMGSGTTAIACINTGRNYIGFETNKDYFRKSQERIVKHTSQLSLLRCEN